jgi:hypothetical protein
LVGCGTTGHGDLRRQIYGPWFEVRAVDCDDNIMPRSSTVIPVVIGVIGLFLVLGASGGTRLHRRNKGVAAAIPASIRFEQTIKTLCR